jgi:hypothetical protein
MAWASPISAALRLASLQSTAFGANPIATFKHLKLSVDDAESVVEMLRTDAQLFEGAVSNRLHDDVAAKSCVLAKLDQGVCVVSHLPSPLFDDLNIRAS